MKKLWVVLIVLGVLGLSILGIAASFIAQQKARAEQEAQKAELDFVKVEKGPITVNVIETGSLEAVRTVEVKSRVGGRVSRLLVDEGDYVEEGQLIAIIDPQETELKVQQDRAQLRGAQANVSRLSVEIEQRRALLINAVQKSRIRISQIEKEIEVQPTISNAAVRSAETAVASAEKGHDLLVRGSQPNARTAAEKAVTDAENNLRKAKADEDRQKELYDLGYGNRRDWEQAELQRQLAETQLMQTKEALGRLENEQRLERERSQQQIEQAKAELSRAKANTVQDDLKLKELEQAKADLMDSQTQLKEIDALRQGRISSQATVEQLESLLGDSVRQLGETEIRAPFSGVIGKRHVQVGELVNALSSFSPGTAIFNLEDRSSMLVKLQINEIDVARLTEGMRADIQVDAFPNQSFTGTVEKIAPSQVTAQAGAMGDPVVKYEVEVHLDGVSPDLKGGMSAKCTMKAIDLKDVLRVPLDFVGQDETGRFVSRVKPGETGPDRESERVTVVIGPIAGNYVQIIEGVAEGEELKRPEYTGPDRRGMMQFGPEEEEE